MKKKTRKKPQIGYRFYIASNDEEQEIIIITDLTKATRFHRLFPDLPYQVVYIIEDRNLFFHKKVPSRSWRKYALPDTNTPSDTL